MSKLFTTILPDFINDAPIVNRDKFIREFSASIGVEFE